MIGQDLQNNGSWLKGYFFLSQEDLTKHLEKIFYNLSRVFDSFLYHNIHSKIRLLIKTTFHVYIGTVKFSSLFKESPCSPVVTFLSFGSEGHGVQAPQGDSIFPYFCSTSLMFFRTIFFFSSFKPSHVSANKPFTNLLDSEVYVFCYLFFI